MTDTILFLAANPAATQRLRFDREFQLLSEAIKRSRRRNQFVLHPTMAVGATELCRALLDTRPRIVHFSGHGDEDNGIVLDSECEDGSFVTGESLAHLLEIFPCIECVILNACLTASHANAISHSVKHAIGMPSSIGDREALLFSARFYDALTDGQSVEFAHAFACAALEIEGTQAIDLPIIFSRHELEPSSLTTNIMEYSESVAIDPQVSVESRLLDSVATVPDASLIYIDLDGFTGINHKFGESVGDQVINVVDALYLSLFSNHEYWRWTKDQFIALVPGNLDNGATELSEKACELIRGYPWENVTPGLYLSASIGFAHRHKGENVMDWLLRALLGSVRAKQLGGNRTMIGPIAIPMHFSRRIDTYISD